MVESWSTFLSRGENDRSSEVNVGMEANASTESMPRQLEMLSVVKAGAETRLSKSWIPKQELMWRVDKFGRVANAPTLVNSRHAMTRSSESVVAIARFSVFVNLGQHTIVSDRSARQSVKSPVSPNQGQSMTSSLSMARATPKPRDGATRESFFPNRKWRSVDVFGEVSKHQFPDPNHGGVPPMMALNRSRQA